MERIQFFQSQSKIKQPCICNIREPIQRSMKNLFKSLRNSINSSFKFLSNTSISKPCARFKSPSSLMLQLEPSQKLLIPVIYKEKRSFKSVKASRFFIPWPIPYIPLSSIWELLSKNFSESFLSKRFYASKSIWTVCNCLRAFKLCPKFCIPVPVICFTLSKSFKA